MIKKLILWIFYVLFASTSISQIKQISRLAPLLKISSNDSLPFSFEQGVTHLTLTFFDMLQLAEDMYGKRDLSWTYIGIQFGNYETPQVRYHPGKRISIALTKNCSNLIPNHPQLYFQMAHEVCHILFPTGAAYANVIEEGVAAYFSKVYVDAAFPDNSYALDNIKTSKYFRAFRLVDKLMQTDRQAIVKIRQLNPMLSLLTKAQLLSLNFGVSEEEAEELTKSFL